MRKPENLSRRKARRASTTGLQYLAQLCHCCRCERNESTAAGKTQEIVMAWSPCAICWLPPKMVLEFQSSDNWAHSRDVKIMFLYPLASRTVVNFFCLRATTA